MMKYEFAQSHITNVQIKMDGLDKLIRMQSADLITYLDRGDFDWVQRVAERLREYTVEYNALQNMQKEMQTLLDFIISETARQQTQHVCNNNNNQNNNR